MSFIHTKDIKIEFDSDEALLYFLQITGEVKEDTHFPPSIYDDEEKPIGKEAVPTEGEIMVPGEDFVCGMLIVSYNGDITVYRGNKNVD